LLSRLLSVDWLAALRDLWARTHVRWLVGILLVALVLRVFWVASVQPDPRDGRFDDTVWFYNTGQLLADGEGYRIPSEAFCKTAKLMSLEEGCDERAPTARWSPGYPLVLAGLFLLPGDDMAAARALNIMAGLALVAGVYYLGQRLWDRRAGLLAAGIMALFPSHIFFSSLVLTESLFAAMAVGLLCLTLAWTMEREVSPRRLFVLGLAAGAVAMVRPEGIVFVAVIVLAWLAVHRSWQRVAAYTALLVLGMAVLFVPWTVRNAIQMRAPVLGTTGLGPVLLQAHHPAADGYPDYLIAASLWARHADIPFPEREIRVNNTGVREALTYAVQHPRRELGLIPDRFAAFYRGDRSALVWNQFEDGGGQRVLTAAWANRWGALSDTYYYAVIGAGLFGLPFWFQRFRGRHWLLLGPFLIYSAMWAFLFVGESRYHFPLLPIFALLAAIGVAAVWERLVRLVRPAPQPASEI
jgi:4-amino-4-deoxy-L-arabinose transferase-like glycosyltransferase